MIAVAGDSGTSLAASFFSQDAFPQQRHIPFFVTTCVCHGSAQHAQEFQLRSLIDPLPKMVVQPLLRFILWFLMKL